MTSGSSGTGGGLFTLDGEGERIGGVVLLHRSSFSCFSFNNLQTFKYLLHFCHTVVKEYYEKDTFIPQKLAEKKH